MAVLENLLRKLNLPPESQQVITEGIQTVRTQLGPMIAAAKPVLTKMAEAIDDALQSGTGTVGDTFRHLCVVGLNKSELLLGGENNPVFADNWQNLADDSLRRGMGLIFFAPRNLDGQPVNPYLFLAGEQLSEATMGTAPGDVDTVGLAQQLLSGMGLLDFCRMPPASPNTINLMLAGDVLFHWDFKDNYILPTTTTSWVRDIEQILKGYPRTTKANLYTNWDTEILGANDRITIKKLREIPLSDVTWLNKPTFQEKYGTQVLALSLLIATGVGALLHFQGRGVDDLNEQIRIIEQQIPREGKFVELNKAVKDQEKATQKRELFYLSVKDAARAIDESEMRFANFEVRVPDPEAAPDSYIVTIEAEKGAYKGWLQEEPVAKDILLNSALMVAVRKPPANTFKIEGLVPAEKAWREFKRLNQPLGAIRSTAVSSTLKTSNAPSAAAPMSNQESAEEAAAAMPEEELEE